MFYKYKYCPYLLARTINQEPIRVFNRAPLTPKLHRRSLQPLFSIVASCIYANIAILHQRLQFGEFGLHRTLDHCCNATGKIHVEVGRTGKVFAKELWRTLYSWLSILMRRYARLYRYRNALSLKTLHQSFFFIFRQGTGIGNE